MNENVEEIISLGVETEKVELAVENQVDDWLKNIER